MEHDPRTLGRSIRVCAPLLTRYLVGFDDSNRTTQAPGLANHAAWTMGHLALTWRRGAGLVSGNSRLPESDFVTADGRGGTERVFDTESVCYGSAPVDEPGLYPAWDRCLEVFDGAIDCAAATFGSASADRLAEEVEWGRSRLALGDLATRMVVHVGMHTGQIVDLRRALGMGKVVG